MTYMHQHSLMRASRALIAAAMIWSGWLQADTTQLDTGAAHLAATDYELAVRLLTPLAERGDAQAQVLLGNMHFEGRGVPKNPQAAQEWYRLAAVQGDPAGQFMLGLTYVNSDAEVRNAAEAVRWIERSAESGNVYAQRFLGKSYRNGWIGLPRDVQRSDYWLSKAIQP